MGVMSNKAPVPRESQCSALRPNTHFLGFDASLVHKNASRFNPSSGGYNYEYLGVTNVTLPAAAYVSEQPVLGAAIGFPIAAGATVVISLVALLHAISRRLQVAYPFNHSVLSVCLPVCTAVQSSLRPASLSVCPSVHNSTTYIGHSKSLLRLHRWRSFH
jgi:hypothetical protein